MVYAVLVYLAIGLVCGIKAVIAAGYSKAIKDARERKLSYAIPVVCAVLSAILAVTIWPFIILDRLISKIYYKFYEKIHSLPLPDIASVHPSSIVAEELFEPIYSKRFNDILQTRKETKL